ncbi:Cell fusion protein cfr1 [Colletotrichum truncatum]|uniref:Cell fusion protein cfr1 n=1 Tax=Colletotrichum truncatum TaxID=5467 RepID=A0ACC3Z0F0_COLTU|nr:Cell fusion protein cfr1 [Colletotrichum truncatum]KAF6800660.1 Cell fusion protein cfr1 [Colletotrichum truncatum]
MLVSLTVGKVDAGVTVLLTPDKRLIEFPSILLPPNISSGSIVDITVSRNLGSESKTEHAFRELQDRIYSAFGASAPATPVLRCRNATQTSVVLEWDPIELATADLISLSLYRNGQKAGNIPRPLQMHSTKISGLAVDTDYTFHLVLRTTAGTFSSDKVVVRTHKMTDLSGITITTGIMPAATREALTAAVDRIGAKIVDSVRIDTTHFVTTEGRGLAWEKAVETNIPVVRPEWVEACEKNGRILGVTKFYLDALRPGPSSDDLQQAPTPPQQQQTPQTQKELPSPPVANSPENGDASSAKSPEGAEKPPAPRAEDEQPTPGDEEKEAEQKRIADQEEQKVRLEDKDEQNLAHRPKEENDSGSENGKGDEDNPNEKPGTSPDGASFQDVAL